MLDIEAVAAVAHEHQLPLLVDNTFATPYLCRPIEWGADIVLHSATKFIGGHGTSIGGVVVDSGQFNWSNGRYPVIADPSPAYHGLQFHETFGTYGYLMKLRAETLRDLGAAMSPFNAFLFLQGLETLSLRMARHVENAAAVAQFLESHELASNVTYPGLRTSRYRPLVDKYLPRGAGAVFSFDCRGGRAGGQDFIRGVTLWSHLANVGDAKSLIIHPASTTHRQLNDDELRAAGVGPGTIRLSVGIEDVDDLIWDLEQGFARGRRGGGAARWRRDDPVVRSEPLSGSADDSARDPQREDHRDRRPVEQPAARQLLRRLLPEAPRLSRHPGQPARDGDPRREELQDASPTCRFPSTSSTSSARRTRCRRSPREAVAIGAGNLWCQFTVINEEGGADRGGGRPVGRDGPVHQGRARPLRRADALARLQHAAHHVGARRPAVARSSTTARVS